MLANTIAMVFVLANFCSSDSDPFLMIFNYIHTMYMLEAKSWDSLCHLYFQKIYEHMPQPEIASSHQYHIF